ncbi:hypothetical protein MNBD_GAMMA09-3726 [hydrothermal vent metagenome]|uniref:Uncharacterized protein n=1 Tax=hydrothermal vent metagenome TaxID=652676 RepID=A0A3B0XDV3_9ZZZZ
MINNEKWNRFLEKKPKWAGGLEVAGILISLFIAFWMILFYLGLYYLYQYDANLYFIVAGLFSFL